MPIEAVEQEAIDNLDAGYAAWAASLAREEVAALRSYQSSERAFPLVNGVLRGTIDASTLDASEAGLVGDVIAGLGTAIAKGQLPAAVRVWRGLRSLHSTFGVHPAEADRLVGSEHRLAGYASCSVVRSVAETAFIHPSDGALLRITVPVGVTAAWLPLVGAPGFSDEYELLLEADLVFRVGGNQWVDGILELDCEVTP